MHKLLTLIFNPSISQKEMPFF